MKKKKDGPVLVAHGGGGEMTKRLIEGHILPRLTNPLLDPLTDAAVLPAEVGRICLTTDASVVQPLFFPGGDIGRLAVSGTVNDLAVMGAVPKALTLSLIIEEGLLLSTLDKVLDSIAAAAKEAGVAVAAGDTKVVEKGRGDGLYISTAGVGILADGVELGTKRVQAGDRVIVTGRIAEHGLAVMSAREGLSFQTALQSDVAPLNSLTAALLSLGSELRFMRDPTRGGVAGVVVDISEDSQLSVELEERQIPISPMARHAAEMLGLDPLLVANEGKLIAVVAESSVEAALAICHDHPQGKGAAVIGRITERSPALVELLTNAGGRRIVRRAYGEELPRIC